jgi:outer membrane receptor protein involved in Fe transport
VTKLLSNHRVPRLLIVSASFAACGSAAAQQATQAPPKTPPANSVIEDVIVTATRRPERLQRVPISITSVSEKELKQRGTDSLTDLAQFAPGLVMNNEGVAQENITMRGISTGAATNEGAQQATVGIYLDDIPAQSAALQGGAVDIPLFDIQRVEVLRGPQGTLFGSGSLSGGVRILSNKPDLDSYHAAIDITGSGTENGGANDAFNLMGNFPLVPDKLAVRVVGYDRFNSGYIDNIITRQKDVNDQRADGGRILIDARPVDNLDILLTLIDESAYGSSDGRSIYSVDSPNIDPARVTETLSEEQQLNRYVAYNLDASYDFGPVRLLDVTTYAVRNSNGMLDFSGYQNLGLTLLGGPKSELNTPDPGRDFSHSGTFTEEVRLSSEGAGPLTYTAGAFYQQIQGTAGQTIFSQDLERIIPALYDLGDLQAHAQQYEAAVFGEATYRLGQFDFTAGLRASRTEVSFVTATTGFFYTGTLSSIPIITPGTQKGYPVTPRFALAWHPDADLTLYAQIARGFRTGGANLTYGFSTGIPAAYTSDTLWNYELGAKATLLDGKLRLNSDFYYIDWQNIQLPTVSPAGNLYIENAGDAQSYGYEAEIAASPVRWLEIGGSLSLNNATLTTSNPTLVRSTGLVGVEAGYRLPASPHFTIADYAQLNFTALDHPAYFRVDENYISEESTDFDDQGAKFGAYSLVNMRAGLQIGHAEIVAFVNNAFDNQGINNAAVATFSSGFPIQLKTAFRNRPLTAGLTFRDAF